MLTYLVPHMAPRVTLPLALLTLTSPLMAGPLDAWLAPDDAVTLSGSFRARYESASAPFRANGVGSDQILLLQTTLKAEAKTDNFSGVVEVRDSRQELADAGTSLSSSSVNPLDILQAYATWRKGYTEVKLGRQTLDLGSKRLVERGSFSNVSNAFTGALVQTKVDDFNVQAFYLLPVNRLPSSRADLLDNRALPDDQDAAVRLFGIHLQRSDLPLNSRGEAYVLGFKEEDRARLATRNRELYTPGLRWYRAPATNTVDFDLEAVGQFGQTHASTSASDTTNLEVQAWMAHAEVGYTWDHASQPRLAAMLEYASGDEDPSDRSFERFDPLFGARRSEFGPTSTYGAFARANTISPGLRFTAKPAAAWRVQAAHRVHWLASDTDTWTTANLRDESGNSGNYLGQQTEIFATWEALPKRLTLEAGIAHLWKGDFAKDAPNAPASNNPTFAYLQATATF